MICLSKYMKNNDQHKAVLIFAQNTLLPNSYTLNDIYNQYKNDDNVLYVTLRVENTFGSLL